MQHVWQFKIHRNSNKQLFLEFVLFLRWKERPFKGLLAIYRHYISIYIYVWKQHCGKCYIERITSEFDECRLCCRKCTATKITETIARTINTMKFKKTEKHSEYSKNSQRKQRQVKTITCSACHCSTNQGPLSTIKCISNQRSTKET